MDICLRACHYLRGDDETSSMARAALDILIDAIVAAQYKRPPADVVEFPRTATRR
ncbi:MAG: fumarate hydratase [Mesorhizobium sp.]|nr:MAG: fumarate hydratase [Mesorhizobium sp.]